MKASSYEKLRQRADEEGAVCHGEFSQHNILLENGRGETAVNFDKWNFDLQVADLGYFMRKILEKHGWSERAAERILNAYSARRPLDEGKSRHSASIFPIRGNTGNWQTATTEAENRGYPGGIRRN